MLQSHVTSGNDLVTEINGHKLVQGHLDWHHTNPHPRLGGEGSILEQRLVIKPTPLPSPIQPFPILGGGLAFCGEQGVVQWWEHSPPTNVARVQILASTPYVGWVCCWFSPLLREVFLRVLRFSLSSKTNISKYQFDQESGRRRTTLWMSYLQIIIIYVFCC